MNIVSNCLITRSDAKVLKEYCIDKSNPLYRQYKGFNTSINLEASDVYTMYAGYVAIVFGDSRNGYEIVVRMNQDQAIKYGNLKSIDVKVNQQVDISQKVGQANKYVKVEYLTTYVKNPFSFRLGQTQMYKDDPAKIIDVSTSVVSNTSLQYNESGLQDFVYEYDGGVPASTQFMLSNNG